RSSEDDPLPVSKEFILAGRAIARCVDLWCDIEKVISVAQLIAQDEASKAGELEEDKTIKQYYHITYRKILQVTPGLAPLITDHSRSAKLANITRKMVDIINNTRSIDTTKLKSYIAQYVAPEPHRAALDPPIVNINGRDQMGLKHPVLTRFICPMDVLADFDENPEEIRKLLECGKIPMKAENFPAVFWSGDKYPGDTYNPEDMCNGLFQGYVLVQVRFCFHRPTSTLNMALKKGTKSCNVFLDDMTTVEPEHIAYVCVQSEKDGEFSYCELYRLVVSFIRNVVNIDWRDDLLKWWNLYLFGNEMGCGFKGDVKNNSTSTSSSEPAEMSMIERMQAQMQAHVAAKATATATGSSTRLELPGAPVGSSGDRQLPSPPISS
ncbi:hypothetical protein V8E55_009856, partial [Tylopilus felleus]